MSLKEFFIGVKAGQKKYGDVIASLVNSILLTVVYVFGVGFTFVFSKIFGKSFLQTEISKEKESYWEEIRQVERKKESFYKQF